MGKILIVDDNDMMLQLLRTGLERAGHEVVLAWSGQEALDKSQAEQPEVIVCDVMMPKMDGFEVLKQLKAKPDYTVPPFVLLTAKADALTRVKGVEVGAVAVLPKPTPVKDILALIEKLTASSDTDSAASPSDTSSQFT